MRYGSDFVNKVLRPVERASRWAVRPLRDRLTNRTYQTCPERIVLVRHRVHITSYYRRFLNWVAAELPEARPYFELRTLPCRDIDWSRSRLVVPWVSENLVSRSPEVYRQLKALESRCGEHSIPLINPVDSILRALKLEASRLIADAGVLTPRIERIRDCQRFRRDLEGLRPPLLIRENRSHGGSTPSYLIRNVAEASAIPLEHFEDPIASQYVDVRSPHDGYFRKYRYMAMGPEGCPMTLQFCRHWEVRGGERDLNEATRREETEYANSRDPNHDRFQQVRRALGLDSLAFDYSYTRNGEPVVWEVNVLPGLGLTTSDPRRIYVNVALRRGMARLVHFYLTRAGLPVPESVDEVARTGQPPTARARRAA